MIVLRGSRHAEALRDGGQLDGRLVSGGAFRLGIEEIVDLIAECIVGSCIRGREEDV